jgi:metallo-beta-lactamase family protein
VEGAKKVRLFGEEIVVQARVESVEGFSGHADCDGLINWIGAMRHKPSRILLVHGETDSIAVFAETIGRRFGLEAHIAVLNETITLGLPVAHRRIVPERLRDPRMVVATYALDTLQTDFITAMEQFKLDIGRAKTKEELDAVLETMPKRLARTAEALVESHQLPDA